jgi:S-DNA-T family DNA segregation ATPase FtsK/SpoIIIE
MGTKVGTVRGLSEDLARALAVANVRVSRRGAVLAVEIPRADPQPVRLLPLLRQLAEAKGSIPPVTACLGLEENGRPLLIRLPSPDVAHILVAGMTGSGKTVLLRAVALSLALRHTSPAELALVMVDPRGGAAFDCFAGLPHLVRPVIRDVAEAVELLASLGRLMEVRDRERVSKPPVVLMIDELADLLLTGGQAAEFALTRLLQRGRGAGMHVIAATQKPTAAVIGTLVKANFPVRLVGKVASPEDAKVASGWRGVGAERLEGRGDFLAVAGRVTRFQAAFVGEAEIAEELARHGWDRPPEQPRLQEPEPVQMEVITLPDPPAPEADPIEELAGRLAAMGWDVGQSYRSACRALGIAEGGGPFAQVQEAVDLLRAGGAVATTLPQKETRTPERSSGAGVLSGSSRSRSRTTWAAAMLEWED